MNVRHLLIVTTLSLLVSGCASFGNLFGGTSVKPVEIQTKVIERTPLNLSDPAPVRGRELEWIVVTPDNVEEAWQRLRDKNVDLVLFAITDEGYEALASNMSEIRNYMAQQRTIIIKYREYYEPKQQDSKK